MHSSDTNTYPKFRFLKLNSYKKFFHLRWTLEALRPEYFELEKT